MKHLFCAFSARFRSSKELAQKPSRSSALGWQRRKSVESLARRTRRSRGVA